MVVTSIPLQLDWFVADAATPAATFNRLRWFRGRNGPDGPFEATTSATAEPASLVGDVEPHGVNGKTLVLRVNGTTEVSILFSDADPVSSAQAAVEIENASALLASGADSDGRIVIETVATGSGASLEVIGGDAAPFLGFLVGTAALGTDADQVFTSTTHQYFYTDQNSDTTYWYKTQLVQSAGAQTSPQSTAFSAERVQGVPKALAVPCYVRITDMNGYPVPGQRVTIHNVFVPNTVVAQNKTWGIFRHAIELVTDRNGYAETRLLRGAKVEFVVEGTGVVRKIEIPSTGDSVDLLEPSLVVEDEFGIVEPSLDFAIRTS